MAPRKIRPAGTDHPQPADLERMVEAQARGEAPAAAEPDSAPTKTSPLDRRRSKLGKLLESLG